MNKTVEKAKEIMKKSENNWYIPNLEIGEICEINDIWDGNGECPENSYSYFLTDKGEDGQGNIDIYINYEFEVIEESENSLDTLIKITNIELI